MTHEVTHVAVGFSNQLLTELDRLLPTKSVLVLEEPDVSRLRGVPDMLTEHPCVSGLITAPTQAAGRHQTLLEAVERPNRVQTVLPSIEYGVVGAAALAEEWGVPGAGLPAANVLRDKALLRTAMDRLGVEQPAWRVAKGPEDIADFRAAHGGRCVLKPTSLQASLGVQRLDEDIDASTAWTLTVGADEMERRTRYAAENRYLLEEWLPGAEVSVECLVHEGEVGFVNVTGKIVQSGRFPVELGHIVPAPLRPGLAETLHEAVRTLVAGIGFRSGILHSEWILVDGRPHLVECAGRLPGDRIDTLIDFAYNGCLISDWLTVLGGAPVPARPASSAAAVRFIAAKGGEVEAIDGVDWVRTIPEVMEVDVTVRPGDTITEITNSRERCGYVLLSGLTTTEIQHLAGKITNSITIKTAASS